jgi:ribosomal 50S subunit-recycling heat shock protein
MRLDKYLKVSRIIKRRTVANEACDAGRVTVNGKVARASYDVKVGDVLTISMGQRPITLKVLTVVEHALKEDAKTITTELTLNLSYQNEQWWIAADRTLLDAISGGILY